MKQIKGVLLFLMSIVLVAFGSQNSKSSKNLVKRLEDETKKVGGKIKENKENQHNELQVKKTEAKQSNQQQQIAATAPTQIQQPVQNSQQQQPGLNQNPSGQALAMTNETERLDGKKGNRRNRKNNKNDLYKAPKHSRLKNSSSFSERERATNVKSKDSSSKSSSAGSNSGSTGGSSGGSSSGGDSGSSD